MLIEFNVDINQPPYDVSVSAFGLDNDIEPSYDEVWQYVLEMYGESKDMPYVTGDEIAEAQAFDTVRNAIRNRFESELSPLGQYTDEDFDFVLEQQYHDDGYSCNTVYLNGEWEAIIEDVDLSDKKDVAHMIDRVYNYALKKAGLDYLVDDEDEILPLSDEPFVDFTTNIRMRLSKSTGVLINDVSFDENGVSVSIQKNGEEKWFELSDGETLDSLKKKLGVTAQPEKKANPRRRAPWTTYFNQAKHRLKRKLVFCILSVEKLEFLSQQHHFPDEN